MAYEAREVDRDEAGKSEDDKIFDEAVERFRRAADWEGEWRQQALQDEKFELGDSDNGWQWPNNVKMDRDINNRPCLTVNKTKTVINRLANESKMNPPEPRIKPVGEKVSYEAAQVWESLLRHIMYVSNGQSVFGVAKESQLSPGIGYWRVAHDFVDDDSFDQDITLEPLRWEHVYLDCDITKVDGSDAMWGFLFRDYNRKELERMEPELRFPMPSQTPGLDNRYDWVRRDAIRVAEYYRIKIVEDRLIYVEDEAGNSWTGFESEVPGGKKWDRPLEEYRTGRAGADYRSRKVNRRQLEWYKIIGDKIVARRTDMKGRYVPIVREPGRERTVEGRLYRSGMVRALKDAQRMYNYNTSAECEVVATQTKSPWIVAAESIEGNESAWATANRQNAAYLTYRHKDEDGDQIPPPQRMDPPKPSEGYLEGMRIAAAELEMASGVVGAQQVNPAMERTPIAIDERRKSADIVNYDFTDNEMQAIRHTAVIILDLAPHIYDTRRLVKIRAKDGTISEITIDPDAEECYSRVDPESEEDKAVKVLFNPKLGKFAVEADVGPAYQTQREAAWHAFIEIVTHSPELMGMIGDLGFLAADWPMANEIAERIRRNIEQTMPWLLKDGEIGPLVAKLTAELKDQQAQTAELMEKLAETRVRVRGKDELRDIEVYDAQTKRLTAEGNVVADFSKLGGEAGGLKKLIEQTVAQMMGFGLEEIEKANKDVIQQKEQDTVEPTQ